MRQGHAVSVCKHQVAEVASDYSCAMPTFTLVRAGDICSSCLWMHSKDITCGDFNTIIKIYDLKITNKNCMAMV